MKGVLRCLPVKVPQLTHLIGHLLHSVKWEGAGVLSYSDSPSEMKTLV